MTKLEIVNPRTRFGFEEIMANPNYDAFNLWYRANTMLPILGCKNCLQQEFEIAPRAHFAISR